MTSASGRTGHTMLNIRNFRDFFSELKQHAAEAPITEWVMAVGISDFGLLMAKVW